MGEELKELRERIDSIAAHASARADAFEAYVLLELAKEQPGVPWQYPALILAALFMAAAALLK